MSIGSVLKRFTIHASWWIAFIIYEVLINYYLSVSLTPGTIYFYACNIGLFYMHAAILNFSFSGRKRGWTIAVIFIGFEITAISILKMAGDYLTSSPTANFLHNKHLIFLYLVTDLSRSILYLILSTLYWYRGHSGRLEKEKTDAIVNRLEADRYNTELKLRLADARNNFLRQQLNPHLISNTLNFIYNTVFRQSPDAGEAVLMLAEILDFSLREPDASGRILLSDELKQIKNLVDINRFRYHYPLDIRIDIEGQTADQKILPLVLLTLTENMFKHGDFRHDPAFIYLSVSESGSLEFRTSNTKKHLRESKPAPGIGIRNIRLRLEHAYEHKYKLKISETPQLYETILTIEL